MLDMGERLMNLINLKFWGVKKPFEHFVDGRTSLSKIGAGFVRYRIWALIFCIFVLLTVAPFPEIYFPVKNSIFILLSFVLLSSMYLRARAKRSLAIKYQLHKISHALRNKHLEIKRTNDPLDIKDLTNEFCF